MRIGVTGHRILAELEKIEAGVDEAISRIEQRFPGEELSVVSALAEGADRIVARRVLGRAGSRLIVPLPLPASEYLNDFTTERSRSEFLSLLGQAYRIDIMPEATSREEAYESSGVFVLNNSDVLLTIWDGHFSRGKGGTGDIVARARRRTLPIAWVHAGNRDPETNRATSLGDLQGLVTCENF